ncbi:GNAT family N-acetyltransferase [Paenibacillus sp. MER 180]|uniref:GNAT family N-acetyltransferase n=1 Tax=Paenibacillus sp. MER 180 TaxID=2939570 RepID=UPI00203B735E|nr:GNAT family N-acetyltransferase [Paenibacillus sp. MER 180]MCM3292643.1 GNAT family N-acetyltransferase [Paenibacillus sp. MER 180]
MKDALLHIELVNNIDDYIEELADLLVQVVEDGASIGFLPPILHREARDYWANLLNPDIKLWIAVQHEHVVGTVQLHFCGKPNGNHRAEIAKLMTRPQARRTGVGRALMRTVEAAAWNDGRTLLVLDTREGDPSNLLYRSIGYQQAGIIPSYARSANGNLDATVLYYKLLELNA